jgi:hypothetical protein
MTKIFISYRTGDESFAAVTIDDRLSERFGPDNVFRDARSIPPAADFERILWDTLARSSLFIVVIGPRWLTGAGSANRLLEPADFVRREIASALAHDLTVLPVLVGDATMPAPDDLPAELGPLAGRQHRRLHARTAEADIRALVEDVARLLGDLSPEPVPARPDAPPAAHHNAVGSNSGTVLQTRDVHGDVTGHNTVTGNLLTGGVVMGDMVAGNAVHGDQTIHHHHHR